MKPVIKLIVFIVAIFLPFSASAGTYELLSRNAKFNVVITVIAIIFSGIVFFLFRMDKRIGKLEEQRKKSS